MTVRNDALKVHDVEDSPLEDDAILKSLFEMEEERNRARSKISARPVDGQVDAPLDMRPRKPMGINLLKYWRLTKRDIPHQLRATLGPSTPILLEHVVTVFPLDGAPPGGVWALGYEFVLHEQDATTPSVVPNDEVLTIGQIRQNVTLGMDLGGKISVPEHVLDVAGDIPGISLSGAKVSAAVDQQVQFTLAMKLTLRKVSGGAVGVGGAVWKMYRQDEPLDRSHSLFQTLLVNPTATELNCTVKTWATKAGWFNTRLCRRTYHYEPEDYTIDLTGLAPS